jgi:hypothetical protein
MRIIHWTHRSLAGTLGGMRIALRPRSHRFDLRYRTSAAHDRRTLRTELSHYSTDRDRIELAAILDRADPTDASYVRQILND